MLAVNKSIKKDEWFPFIVDSNFVLNVNNLGSDILTEEFDEECFLPDRLEQERGVFAKTLRNMWIAVNVLNPLIAFLVICIIPISSVESHQNSFLSFIGTLTIGKWLATIISINAVSVLSGAVLTSFVGVSGLIKRMHWKGSHLMIFLKRRNEEAPIEF